VASSSLGDKGPALGLQWDFAPLPGAAAHFGSGLEQRQLVGPGGQAAIAAELKELGQYGDERVVSALLGEVVVIIAAQLRKRRPAAVDLEALAL
jgi:hypothetical protein